MNRMFTFNFKNKIRQLVMLAIPLLWAGVISAQSIDIDIAPKVVCKGQPTTLSATLIGYNPALVTSYTWRFGNGDSAVLTAGSPVASSYTYQYLNAGIYDITLVTRFNDGSSITRQTKDTVFNLPVTNFNLTNLDSQCFKANSYSFLNTVTPGAFPNLPIKEYKWVWGDGTDLTQTGTDLGNLNVSHSFPLGNRRFQVSLTATDVGGCQSSKASFVFVAPDLNPRFSLSGVPKCDVSPYVFINQSPISIGDVQWFKWHFDDGTIYESANPVKPCDTSMWRSFVHNYTKSGVFTPSLVVKHKKFNCVDSFNFATSGNQLPENIIIKIDIRSRRTNSNDTIADSVCIMNRNQGSVCLYNEYSLQGVNTPIQILWDYADPNANPPGSDKFLNVVTRCYKYQAQGHFFPTLSIACPGQPVKTVNFWSRVDTLLDNVNYNPPPTANPRLNTINGYVFTAADLISKYKYIYPPETAPTGIPVTSVNAATDEFLRANHRLFTNDTIVFTDLGGLTNVTVGTQYYLTAFCRDFFTISTTPGGPKIDIGFTGGVMPKYRKFSVIPPSASDSIVSYWKWFTYNAADSLDKRTRSQFFGYGVNVLGPTVAIENPIIPIVIAPYMRNQCGPTLPIEFVNASSIYQSNHLYIRWDFADDYAPTCTSWSEPNFAAPNNGMGPYTNAQDLINRTEGRFIANGISYPGRVNCRYSHDTLPIHSYRNWYTEVYKWYKYGHDFAPFDSGANGWTKNPADVTWNGTTGKKMVAPNDMADWGKPIFSSGPAPIRMDTMAGIWPQDIRPNNIITINAPIPDPFAQAKGFWSMQITAGYTIDTGGFITPNNLGTMPDGTLRRYRGNSIIPGTNKTFYEYVFERVVAKCYTVTLYMKDSANGQSADPMLGRKRVPVVGVEGSGTATVTDIEHKTYTVYNTYNLTEFKDFRNQWVFAFRGDTMLVQQDGGGRFIMFKDDPLVVDEWDCGGESTVNLPLMKPDAYGLGKTGSMCPGLRSQAGGDPTIVFDNSAGTPGLAPTCASRTFLLFNYDSLFDRYDNTPCDLDGFVGFDGVSPMTGTGTTPGGLTMPPFFNGPNFNPLTIWQSPNGARNVTHYVPPTAGVSPFNTQPFSPDGYVTVGLIIGNGCLSPTNCAQPGCLTDTVWYHKFFHFITLDANFTYTNFDTTQAFVTAAGPPEVFANNPNYREPFSYLRGKGVDQFGNAYAKIWVDHNTVKQDFVKADAWDWGDGFITVDSFYMNQIDTFVHLPKKGNPSVYDTLYFEKGTFPLARVRYEFNAEEFPWTIMDTMHFPVGKHVLDTIVVDTVWRCNDPLRAGPPQAINYRNVRIDSAFLFLRQPVEQRFILGHRYFRTSFEQKVPSGVAGVSIRRNDITPITHIMTTITDCQNVAVRQIVIGVIDTFWVNDTTLCVGETAYFTDSIRYWFPFSQGNYNPFRPLLPGMLPYIPTDLHGIGMQGYPNDTTKVWPDPTQYYQPLPLGSGCSSGWALMGGVCVKLRTYYYERIYWDFESDGVIDAHGKNPTHKFTKPGRFKVSMISRDSVGYWDTCSIFINVVQPIAKFTSKQIFNCGDTIAFRDSSIINDWCFQNYGFSCDNVKERRWWFGDFGYGKDDFRSVAMNPVYDYRKNGWYKVMLVVETEQGCQDTFRRDIFLAGPRPRIKLITDTLGCAPYKVKLVSFPNDSGLLSVTKLTIVRTGLPSGLQIPLTVNPDTAEIIYDKPGVYYLSTISYDNNPPSTSTCPAVFTPDTTNGLEKGIWIHVKAPYKVDIETDRPRVCVGDPFTVFNRSALDTITRFRMYNVDSGFTNILDTLYKTNFRGDTSFKYVLNNPGTYRLVLHSTRFIDGAAGCELFDTTTMVAVRTKAEFKIDSLGGSKYYINNQTDTTTADHYKWIIYNEDGSIFKGPTMVPTNNDPFFSFELDMKNDTGFYKVCLWAYTPEPDNCEDSTCRVLENRFRIKVKIPNVFTPNGDGINDQFKIDIEGNELYDLKIWNRWGGLVFDTKDANTHWNGKVQNTGDLCAEGTYYFVFKYKLRTQSEEEVRGTITLIRD